MWSNPPAAVSALRDMIVASSSAATAGLVQSHFHYPAAVLEADDTTVPNDRPLCVIGEESAQRRPYCEPGVRGLPSGTLEATIYAELSAGELEDLADDIASDLMLSVSGLPNINVTRGLCSDPLPGQRATDDSAGVATAAMRGITLTITYGLNP